MCRKKMVPSSTPGSLSAPMSHLSRSSKQSCSSFIRIYFGFLLLYLLLLKSTHSQNIARVFPPLFNIAKDQDASTVPANSDCGVPSRTAFCRSSLVNTFIDMCLQDFCIQQCPRRDITPHPTDLLANAIGYSDCVSMSQQDLHLDSELDSFAVNFNIGTNCYLTPTGVPSLGSNGAMTFTIWVFLTSSLPGTVFEKWGMDGSLIVQVRVSPTLVQFKCRTENGLSVIAFTDAIPQQQWTYLAFQVAVHGATLWWNQRVYGGTVSYFINDVGDDFAAADTQTIDGIIQDSSGFVRVGQDQSGTDQFTGRLQDVYFFSETLTNREIQEVKDGVLLEVDIQTECRCPETHPRVRPTDTRYCIRNGVPDNIGDQVLRLNEYAHPLEYLVDGDALSYWVSSFLEDVWVEIDFADQFEVFHVLIEFYSPQPKAMEIQRKKSPSEPWSPWQYYAEDCLSAYNMPNNGQLQLANSVNCIQFSTIANPSVPYSQGNITFYLLSVEPVPRPYIDEYYNTDLLLEFVQAWKVRVNMKEHYYVTQPRHRYFGVYEIFVNGRCNCSGHGAYCDLSERPYRCGCNDDSHTRGNKCEECYPLFNNKPFKAGTRDEANRCKKCECHGHADACYYDINLDPDPEDRDGIGGGVCIDCKANTTGQHCEMCAELFYSGGSNMYQPFPCKPCDCHPPGVQLGTLDCEKESGQCMCKQHTTGRKCEACQDGYYNLQTSNLVGCEACGCNVIGAVDGDIRCGPTTGQCSCKSNVRGSKCENCLYGFWGMTAANPDGCQACNCDPFGSIDQYCDEMSGQCYCKSNRVGLKCEMCEDGYYDFNSGCLPCDCDPTGTREETTCDEETGTCSCKLFVTGDRCDECDVGYYNFGQDPDVGCLTCGCDPDGTTDEEPMCDPITGDCFCKDNVQGQQCDTCKAGFTNITSSDPGGCVACQCDPSGTVGASQVDLITTCYQDSGACTCLPRRYGQMCDKCEIGYFKDNSPEGGCSPCNCFAMGTVDGVPCDSDTGQCECKISYGNTQCSECAPTFYRENFWTGCKPCVCDTSGSLNNECAVEGGQCQCKQNTEGRTCSQCKENTSVLDADNPDGCSGTPSQQPPPMGEVLSSTQIKLTWDPPDNPNGIIQWYKLYQEGQLLLEAVAELRTYIDEGLDPFTEYSYNVEAGNLVGSTMSPSVTYRTLAGSPTGPMYLLVDNIGSRSADFSWSSLSDANGIIQQYMLNSTSNTSPNIPVQHYSGLSLAVTLNNLIPYTLYTFKVYACTGPPPEMCVASLEEIVPTQPALPESQAPPIVTPVDSTQIYLAWDPPALPNGIISAYEVWMRGTALDENGMNIPPALRIFYEVGVFNPQLPSTSGNTGTAPPTSTTATTLDPNTEYEFQVVSQNSVGKVASLWAAGMTLEAAPIFMPVPVVYTVNSTYVNITWMIPTNAEARGEIDYFEVYRKQVSLNPAAPPDNYELVVGGLPPNSTFYVSGPYVPNMQETFNVGFCNSVNCITSTDVIGSTAIAAPEDQSRPLVEGYNYSTMGIEWIPPAIPNSPSIDYVIHRKDVPFNQPPPIVETGTRFPGIGYYKFPPETVPQGVTFTGIEFEFKTQQMTGLIMYAASEGQQEFLLIQLSGGRPYFIFDPEGCTTSLSPVNLVTVNDLAWHSIRVTRSGAMAHMFIDDRLVGSCPTLVQTTNDEGLTYLNDKWHTIKIFRTESYSMIELDEWKGVKSAECSTSSSIIGSNTGVYIGGLPDDYVISRQETDYRKEVQDVNFKGCIRNFKIMTQMFPEEKWEYLDWSKAERRVGDVMPAWEGCPVEGQLQSPSILFLGTGFISMSVQEIETAAFHHIKFEMRTEYRNGLLFFMLGEFSHFLARLDDGELYVEYLSFGTHRFLIFPDGMVSFCDGQWHTILIDVPRDELTVTVDSVAMPTNNANSSGEMDHWYFDLELMLGGIQPGSLSQAYIDDNLPGQIMESFGGCIRNVDIYENFISQLSRVEIVSEEQTVVVDMVGVYLDGCPIIVESGSSCMSSASVEVYEGGDLSTHDGGLLAFTEYLYQVEATNDIGSTFSPWSSGRTREGPPTGVSPPYYMTAVSGYIIEAMWDHPTGNTGLLTAYILRGYNLDYPDLPPAETIYNDTANTLEGQITDAIPFSSYSVVFVACTVGGCTESEPAQIPLLTQPEVPGDVQSPTPSTRGGTYLYLQWDKPTWPNGILTGYILYQQGQEIYRGNLQTYNVTGLLVFTGYPFYVEACTSVGCSKSPTVVIDTAQLPPEPVLVTKVVSKGSYAIDIEWNMPSVLNGVLERFLVYVSDVSMDIGEVLYNETDLFLTATIQGLSAGTTYFVRVGACTGGGCSVSDPLTVTTAEAPPEDLPDPVVVSPNPFQLDVSWDEPGSPNGVILKYELYVNDTLMYTSPSVREYSLTGLEPYQLFVFYVKACTVRGCGQSARVNARTQEAPPEGFIGLSATVPAGSSRNVSVKWNSVTVPNGNLFYDVYFEGLFYVDPANWDYTVMTDRRSLLRTQSSGIWFDITNLVPYSIYQVQVNASNSAGYILSTTQTVSLPEGSPDGVRPPDLTSPTSRSVRATWTSVGQANSDTEPVFQLQFREPETPGSQIVNLFAPTTATTYLKEDLVPYTQYEFRLNASNPAGYTLTPWVSITTKQDRPEGISAPGVTDVEATWAQLTWTVPEHSNGILTEYKIYQNDVYRESVEPVPFPGLIARHLIPSTLYIFKVAACTIAGCTISPESAPARTDEAPPQNLTAPTLRSESPTSVLIVWDEPLFPNGEINTYTIRRKDPDGTEYDVATVPATQQLYTDHSSSLSPYTTYDYQIVATTQEGSGYSPWASVTTLPSGPGGVMSPSVVIQNATSVLITWETPISPNGILEYFIVKLPIPQFEILNTSQRTLQVAGLMPYTNYFVSIIACTVGGCTESVPTYVTTNPTIPSGQLAPVGTPHSQTYISVLWEPPLYPNGPNITYELLRTKVRQLLEPLAQGFGLWESIFKSSVNYYEDRGLTIYTTYQYKVTVFNSFGQVTSEPSEEVTTYGGTPTVGISAYASALSHTALKVWWDIPSVSELQGGVVLVMVSLSDGDEMTSLELEGDLTFVDVGNLLPTTTYSIEVTLVIHGGAMVTSPPITATTLDGAPEGLEPPLIFVVNDMTLRIVWQAPAAANGQVTGYYIYLDGEPFDTGMTTPGSYLLTDLQPYTIYTIQLEVCTVFDCVRSDEIIATTAEAVPGGVDQPTAYVQASDSVQITWVPPSEPNGIILRYNLLRKARLRCLDIVPTEGVIENEYCMYFECDINEFFCGSQCYSGPMTCCSGELHLNKPGYECCGPAYIPKRQQASDVCCGGQFQNVLANHECCAGRYVEVLQGQICCPDPEENRVDIGYGDSCCGSIPYNAIGPQVCCDGILYNGYQHQCCGGILVDEELQCCSDDNSGTAHEIKAGYYCCGQEYVAYNNTACCSSISGDTQVHTYSTYSQMQNANEKCCGTERISNGLNCCNGNGYNPLTQICADISDQMFGCGAGVVCPSYVSSEAYCDRCDFNQQTTKCGSSMVPEIEEEETVIGDYCWTSSVVIYTTETEFEYVDMDLLPFTLYEYAISAENGAGSTTSTYASTLTFPTTPEEVLPPVAIVDEINHDSITLTWLPPVIPNGEIIQYVLQRDGVEIFRNPSALQYTDSNAIQPYKTYIYILSACTIVGCTDSQPLSVATLQATPEGIMPPEPAVVAPTFIELQWAMPSLPNGFLTEFYVYRISAPAESWQFPPTTFTFTVTDLTPDTLYQFLYSACTEAGCAKSSVMSIKTAMDAPVNLEQPGIIVISSEMLQLVWNPPEISNGLITAYNLYRTQGIRAYTRIGELGGDDRSYTDSPLTPGATYKYIVEAVNGGGSLNSSEESVTMPLQTPVGIPRVDVIDIQATELGLEWMMTNGTPADELEYFSVVLNEDKTSEILTYNAGMSNSIIADGLMPATRYVIRLRACLAAIDNSCGTGPTSSGATLQAAPTGFAPPILTALGPNSVEIKWSPPENPNGVIIRYLIHRRLYGDDGAGLLINELYNYVTSFVNVGPELLPYTMYEYRITGTHYIVAITSEWTQVRTLEAPPSGQAPPSVSQVGAYAFTASWEPPSSSNGVLLHYHIYYRPVSIDPTQPSVRRSVTVPEYARQTQISGLTPYTEYQVQVASVNSAGEMASTWVMVMTGQAAPAELSAFMIEKVSNGMSVILRWSRPGQPNGVITNYLIYEGGNINPIFQGLSQMFEYRRLQPYTEYSIQLEACTIGGCARTPMQTFRTATVAPANLPAPTLSGATATQVTITWTNPIDANGKIIRYQVLRTANSMRRKRDTSPLVVYETTETDSDEYSYTDTNLQPFTRYMYQIKAENAAGSILSPEQAIETAQAAPLGLAPPQVTNVFTDYDKLQITWSVPQQMNGILSIYTLERNDTVTWSFAPEDPKEYIDTGLAAFTTYSYTISACTAGGCTTSDPTIATTPQSTPYFVNPPSLQAASSTAIEASWIAPQITNGEIKEYKLKVDDVMRYTGTALTYTITNLTPYQLYTFVLSACTYGGCTDSLAVNGRPNEAPPDGMQAPLLRVTSSTSIEITWQAPDFPNGIITSYEVRRDNILIDSTVTLTFNDYEVLPGTEYTYRVTAFNSQGRAESPPASATTYASSPSGMEPPNLEALGPTSVRASWSPPLLPNGNIHNYTLFAESIVVYAGLGLSALVDGLTYWTTYQFRVQACTSSGCTLSQAAEITTLEATPIGQSPPELLALQGDFGEHNGVEVRWEAPRQPNGIIIKYEIYRRAGTVDIQSVGGTRKLIYSGLEMMYRDNSNELLPYSPYDYQVLAYNSVGATASLWRRVYTMEAAPENVFPPVVKTVTATSVTLELMEPEIPNGNIEEFIIYFDNTLTAQGRSTLVIIGETTPLTPATSYEVVVEACTGGGCTASPAIMVTTMAEPPSGLQPPTLGNITQTSIDVSWQPPAMPNGEVLEYELSFRSSCPQPYSELSDPVDIPCTEGLWVVRARGLLYYVRIENLQPYTNYEFQLHASNEVGTVSDPPSTVGHTLPAPPEYNRESPPSLTPSGNMIIVNWETSFFINGEVIEFILFRDDEVEYNGYRTSFNVFRDSQYLVYEFRVRLITDQGQVETPTLIFDPTNPDDTGVVTQPTEPVASSGFPFYQEVWFIVLIAIVALVILFLSIACCLRLSGRKAPYIRERMPLQAQQMKSSLPLGYCVDPYTGSLISTELGPHSPSVISNNVHPATVPHPAYLNPAYSQMSLASHPGSLADLNLDKLSHKSSKWDDDDDETDWEGHLPPDSGLHSLAYGEDYDAVSERPISVLKEHTMFTDTHL